MLRIVLAGVLSVPAAYAADERHPEKAAPETKVPQSFASPQADDKSIARMQEHMKKMQGIMARMQKTSDPAERQKLIAELTQAMQEGMKLDMVQMMMGQMMEPQNTWRQEHMKKMQGIMARMQKTTDPAERQKLMTEHMQAMQEGMKTMRGMSGMMHGMTGGGMMGTGMMGQAPKEEGGKPGMSDGGPMSPAMLESRMEMMQMMMEQMMQHQKALESAPK
jgi:hypothetical protein